ncbi:peptidoglycan/xylan/chitin deacetylase (PgdA/CDA1 family) [Streptacidiphilus sp. MAP12-16]|uniref:polysaccharide deacetylase family protein n=1 Tax=Streptacidiphilus sp. MAP12-16 TaxID=3156300 RepID=UPI0035155EAE
MSRVVKAAAVVAGGLALAHAAPALTSIQPLEPLRTRLFPGYAGQGDPGHIALTFDDGPDPLSTPRFLKLLERRGVTATFFLLGFMLERDPGLGREIAAAGHEVAVHGYLHRPMLLRTPRQTRDDLSRAHALVSEATGETPRWYRPPYGIATTSALRTARGLGMDPVLWTSWGADWRAGATGSSVYDTVTRNLKGGGTILLHDSDCTSAPASWTATLSALPRLLDHCEEQGWKLGPLAAHGL